MVTSFLVTVWLLLLGPLLISGLSSALPIAIVFHWGAASILSGLFRNCEFGTQKIFLVYSLSAFLTYFTLRGLRFSTKGVFSGRVYFLILGVVIALTADLGTIYLSSGWEPVPNFRPPFLHDIERDVVIINSLLRHGMSPYLPHSQFAYQLLWYHWASLPVSLFKGITTYPYVLGVIYATGIIFLSVLIWLAVVLRPSVVLRWKFSLVILLIFFAHTDLFNGIRNVITTGHWGIETDLPAGFPIFFRYSSLKSLCLVAPQHAFGLSFLLTYLVLGKRRLFAKGKKGEYLKLGILTSGFVASPVLFGMVIPFFFLFEILKNPLKFSSVVSKALASFGFGILFFYVTCGFWPSDLLMRPNGPRILWPEDSFSWRVYFPWLWLATLGIPFVLWVVSFFQRLIQKNRKSLYSPEVFALVFGVPFFCYIYAHSEIRRYYSLISIALLFLSLVQILPSKKISRLAWFRYSFIGFAGLSLFLHGVFLYSYLFKPSTVDASIPWKDYFQMNQVVKERFQGLPILAAADNRLGIEKPLVMQVTTSFSAPVEIAIHTRLNKDQFESLKKIYYEGDPFPYAKALGYEAILWGPVEERVWGEKIREKYLKEEKRLASTGSVSLYQWPENIKP